MCKFVVVVVVLERKVFDMQGMTQKIQKFGGAMFTPVLLFAFAGVIIGLGTLFTTEAVMGSLASPDSMWYKCWNVVLQGGWTVFSQLPLLFVVGLPVGLANKQHARCSMEALVLYLTFHYFLSTILGQWGPTFGIDFTADVGGTSGLAMIANIKTLDMGMMGALLISGIAIAIHNKFFDVKLPVWLQSFSGSTLIFAIGFFVMIPVAVLSAIIWPKIQILISSFQVIVSTAGAFGVWLFIFLERILIPFGLHHILYSPIFYDNALVQGGIIGAWSMLLPEMAGSTEPLISFLPEAGLSSTSFSKIFGCPGIALAFYATAKPEKKAQLAGLLIPVTLTAMFCGVTEPIEFTFLFVAPMLFVVHALLAATISTVMYLAGIVGYFTGGLIEVSAMNFIPLMANHAGEYLKLLLIGLAFTGIWFVVFRFLILKFDFKTPGREDDAVKMYSKSEFKEKQAAKKAAGINEDTELAENILSVLGGKDNIVDVTNCVTRLRLNVKDETLVGTTDDFKSVGTHGAMVKGKSVQVIVGMTVPAVREEFEKLL